MDHNKNISYLIFYVNGKKVCDFNVNPEWNLLYYLRYKLKLVGAKLGCGEGGCGSCSVMLSRYNSVSESVSHWTVNACLTPVASLHGLSLTTIEGLGSIKTRLHPIQERLAKSHGSQCGFCTPGFVMAMYTLLRENQNPSLKEIEENIAGNLCRCTGYRPILEGLSTFSNEQFNPCGSKNCCRNKRSVDQHKDEGEMAQRTLFNGKELTPYDSTQEIIFPPELKLCRDCDTEELLFVGPRVKWYRPVTVVRLLEIKALHSEAKIVAGNTEIGIDCKFKNIVPEIMIDPSRVTEMKKYFVCKSGVIIGAALSLSFVEKELKKVVEKYPRTVTETFRSVLEMLRWFGSKQIRNMASIGGNIMTSSPISDLNPVLLSVGAQLKFKSLDKERKVTLDESFFTGYRTNNSAPDEVLIDIFVPFSKENEYCCSFKQSRRRDDDIAIVNAGFRVLLNPLKGNVVEDLVLSYGGMQEKTVVAKSTMKSLIGIQWKEGIMERAVLQLSEDLPLDLCAQGGMVHYRRTLALSFFFKFYLEVMNKISQLEKNRERSIEGSMHSDRKPTPILSEIIRESEEHGTCFPEDTGCGHYQRASPSGTQFYYLGSNDVVGQPIVHNSGLKHATGEAVFVDDLPRLENELWAVPVLSEKASAKILEIDASQALAMEGIVGFYSAKDVPGSNKTGIVVQDEEVFASEEVHYSGETVGVVVAEDRLLAVEASKKIRISYEEFPPTLTIEDALKKNQVWKPRKVQSGDVSEGFKACDHVMKGEMRVGGQEHFYMEPQTCIVIPKEEGHIEVISATQHLAETQRNVASVLGVSLNTVVCKTKRLGGGFGGKEIKAGRIASYAAVPAAITNRPVRIVLDRSEDMKNTGGRHPVQAKWEVGFNKDGSLVALKLDLYANAGYSLDVSDAMAIKAIMHADNVYRIPNTLVSCTCCRTNLASNTACRGTGAPQSILIMENIISDISGFLNIPSHAVREMNMHKTSDPTTHFGQKLENCTIKQCWDEVISCSDYNHRVEAIKEFNKKNPFVKKGICAVPSKMAVSFGVRALEHAGAMVQVYSDGSIILTHSGVEMGQGLHTKMIQVASSVLGVHVEMINVIETSTDKIPNTTPTAASCSSDLNGMAVKEACEQIMDRLRPYMKGNPTGTWSDWIKTAIADRVSLLGIGFHKTPGLIDFDFEKQEGSPITYFAYGAAVSEVEVDTLTGNHTVLRTDIVMDVGQSLNPAIDIGQIEGAFMFGCGLYTLEELEYKPEGSLLTQGPGNYKIPGVRDIPCKFNVSLLRGTSNPRAIYSSRGVGEPPLTLATSVFFALKDAISNHRTTEFKETKKISGVFRLDSPATCERIRLACVDRFTEKVIESTKGNDSRKPWSIRV